jgi:predicted nicotinamide N-methyase
VRGQRVLELGAGCGLVGIVAATLGAREVCLTDLPYALPLLTENIMANQHQFHNADEDCRVTCTTCDWFHPSAVHNTTVDVILVADCVWLEELVDPLLHTLDKLTQEASSSSCTTRILITYQRRGKSTHERFLNGLHSIFHRIHDIDTNQFGIYKPDVFSVLECQK